MTASCLKSCYHEVILCCCCCCLLQEGISILCYRQCCYTHTVQFSKEFLLVCTLCVYCCIVPYNKVQVKFEKNINSWSLSTRHVIVKKKHLLYDVLVHNLLSTVVLINVLLFLIERHTKADDINNAYTLWVFCIHGPF